MAKISRKLFKEEDISRYDGNRLHILLVENSPFQHLFIGHVLKQLGHTVCVASDGFEALSVIQRDRDYDVLLVSCHLPLMDGLKATKFIREAERTTGQHLPIIGISATASPEDCFKAGMDDFLRKPLQKLLLKAVLGRWLREKKGRTLDNIPKGLSSLLLIAAIACFGWLASIMPVFAEPDSQTKIGTRAHIAKPIKIFSGLASWYGMPFHGRRTASGQIYDMNKLTAAHLTLPLHSEVLVVNPRNGKTVVIKVNDRGPYIKNRVFDLSRAAAIRLGIIRCGIAYVNYSVVPKPQMESRRKCENTATTTASDSFGGVKLVCTSRQ